MLEDIELETTKKLPPETPLPVSLPDAIQTPLPAVIYPSQAPRVRYKLRSKREMADAHVLEEQCRQLCLSVFFREHAPARSLGVTSSIGGEGKSFIAAAMAGVLARDSDSPVTLLECNWEHPCLHQYFGLPSVPGLAEWLRGDCSEAIIRHKVGHNLTVILAGDRGQDAVKLLQPIRKKGLLSLLGHGNDLFIVDLPAIVPTAYGALAASLVESLVIVTRAGVTPDALIAKACAQLKGLPVEGMILNHVASRIPRWIREVV